MSELNRQHLKQEFSDGERPSGNDFADLMDSFLNKADDGLSIDDKRTLVLNQGLRLGGSSATTAGTLRFSGGKVQFHNGTAFVDLASGGTGAFQPAGGGAVFYGGGNVGIGTAFTDVAPPAFRLDVDLGPNASDADRARFGNAVLHNGSGASASAANFSHRQHTSSTNYAVRQTSTGEVQLNAPLDQPLTLRQAGNQVRLAVIATNGRVLVGSSTEITGSTAALQVNGSLQITGDALKPGGGSWSMPSDVRLKEDVRDFELGLPQLLQVRTVRFRYNGKAGTPAGLAGVGIIGQEMEQVFPEMVRRVPARLDEEPESVDLRIYDGSALTYVLVNAVKELAARIERLEHTPPRRKADGDDN